ncbi:hypothetical protein [Planktotalea sp.]|uniref:hypothetical protein n=1 Tax=Planktotalea sp. TaxID=2029877 RepID=UPI003D6C6D70
MDTEIETRKLDLEVKKFEHNKLVNARAERSNRYAIFASLLAAFVGLGSLLFSIFAQRAAEEASTASAMAQKDIAAFNAKINVINANTQQGRAKIELLRIGVNHLEKMIDKDLSAKERARNCFIAAQFAIVEDNDFEKSRHILSLHRQYLERSTQGSEQDSAQDMCKNKVLELISAPESQALSVVAPDRVPDSFEAPETNNKIAENVVVLASYRSNNCSIAKAAQKAFTESKIFDEPLIVAFSRSQHYSVVYSPTQDSTPINEFLVDAREKGADARERLNTAEEDDIDRPNLQYVADAFIAGTSGWQNTPVDACPDQE